jgi:hypothetical protein
MTRIFITYSHDSEVHRVRVRALAHRLGGDDFEVHLDADVPSPPQGWPRWMIHQIQRADFVVVVCTETYRRRFEGDEERGTGLGVDFEGLMITQQLFEEAQNTSFVPVILEAEDRQHIPMVLRGATFYQLERDYAKLQERLRNPSAANSRAPSATPEGRSRAPSLPEEARGLAGEERFREMLKIAYLVLRIDQYTEKLGTPDPHGQDRYLWGWSVCDPRRKKKVAKPQTSERRAASIVVTSFVLAGLFEDVPRFGLRADDVLTGLVRSLQKRFRMGVFGTLQTTVTNIEGRVRTIVVPNCRHIAAAVDISLRLLAMQSRTASVIGLPRAELLPKVGEALRYLYQLPGMALFSEDPDVKDPPPDVATCAIVLGMIESLETIEGLVFEDAPERGGVLPVTQEQLRSWRKRWLEQGIEYLSQHRQRAGAGPRLWQYPPPGNESSRVSDQASNSSGAPLYHTARILYLTRNLLADPAYNERLVEIAEDLAALTECGLLPAKVSRHGNGVPHITNTAFFLSALLPRDGGPPTEELTEILLRGLRALPGAFFDAVGGESFELLDLRADGLGMLLRLGRKLMDPEARRAFADELRSLDALAATIQGAIREERIGDIASALRTNNLAAAVPIVTDRVVEARRLWFGYVRAAKPEAA